MKTVRLSETNIVECAKKAAEVLRVGGVVLYPTDTLYGLGADALSDEAVDKIYTIKEREEGKPIHCIVADLAMAEEYAVFDQNAHVLARQFLPGPLTLILKKRQGINTGIARYIETIGIRIPKSALCIEMARAFGKPITTTSANRSGENPERTVKKILAQLRESARMIDLAIGGGAPPAGGVESKPSTVVDVHAAPVIVREGTIPAGEIWEALRAEP